MADDLRDASRSHWAEAASGWATAAERREAGPAGAAADWMLEAAGLRPGARVLELACGAGDVGLRAAEIVGGGGHVVLSDFAEPMVEIARERAAGLRHVEARVLDAEQLEAGDVHFDAVLCRFGYMLMPNPAAALQRTHGVLDEGGNVALAVWGAEERNPWLSLITDSVMEVLGAPRPEPGTPGPFALADPDRLRGLLADAGFEDVRVEALASEATHESIEAWWAGTQQESGPIASVMRHLPAEQVEAIRERACGHAREYVGDDGSVRFPAEVIGATGRRTG